VPDAITRLLVVDDNADAANILCELLAEIGYEVQVAYDAQTALDVARTFKPMIALLDIGMPVVNGYELARRMREQQPTVRLVAITGHHPAPDRDKSLAAGFDVHLGKPVDFDKLVHVLADLSEQ
jgi:CheY-like chemotaxis protein